MSKYETKLKTALYLKRDSLYMGFVAEPQLCIYVSAEFYHGLLQEQVGYSVLNTNARNGGIEFDLVPLYVVGNNLNHPEIQIVHLN